MESLNLATLKEFALVSLYIAYLCWVMFRGLRLRKVKLRVYLIMTVLLLYGTIKEFNGIHSAAEIVNISIILAIGLIKGIVLGKRKITQKINGIWYIHHDKTYIILWIAFFGFKVLLSQILVILTGTPMPPWHILLYFCFYYPWRTFNVFKNNPTMCHDILGTYH